MVFSEMDGYLLQEFVKFGVLGKLFCIFNHPIKDTSGVMATRVYEFLRIFEIVYYIIAEGKPERGFKKELFFTFNNAYLIKFNDEGGWDEGVGRVSGCPGIA